MRQPKLKLFLLFVILLVILNSVPLTGLAGHDFLQFIQGPTYSTPPADKVEKFALLVGINSYESSGVRPLESSVNDITDMAEVMRGTFAFPDLHIKMLRNREATKQAIIGSFKSHLIENAKRHRDAIIVFQFSGQGRLVKNGSEGHDAALLAIDSGLNQESQILNSEIASLITELAEFTSNIVLIIDAPYFGTLKQMRARRENSPPSAVGNYVLLAAASPSELAYESSFKTERGVRHNGVFTYYLLQALRRAKPGARYREIFEEASAATNAHIPAQHPQMEGDWQRPVFGEDLNRDKARLLIEGTRAKGMGNLSSLNGAVGSIDPQFSHQIFPLRVSLAFAQERPSQANAELSRQLTQSLSASKLVEIVESPPTDNSNERLLENKRALACDVAVRQGKFREVFKSLPADVLAGTKKQPQDNTEIYYLSGPYATPLFDFFVEPDNPNTASTLTRVLKNLARQRNLKALYNREQSFKGRIKLTIVRVQVNKATGQVVKEEVRPEDQLSVPALKLGEYFRLQIKNQTESDLFINVFDIDTGGNIRIMYPPSGPGELIAAGESKQTTVYYTERPTGYETLKVIATASPTDFRFLTEEGNERRSPPSRTPLQFLLSEMLEQPLSSPQRLAASPRDWTTAQVDFLITDEPLQAERDVAKIEETLAEAVRLDTQAEQSYLKGEYDEALRLTNSALAINEKILGAESAPVAASLNRLGVLYQLKGDYGRAESVYERALAINERILGTNSPMIASALNNLSMVYLAEGDFNRAEDFGQRALRLSEKTLGHEHPDVTISLCNLAQLYQQRGDYAEAEAFYLRALAINEKVLSPNHPDVAATMYRLASLYQLRRDYSRAEILYQRALSIYEKTFGADNITVVAPLSGLAELYRQKKEYARSKQMYERAIAIIKKQRGDADPQAAELSTSLAELLIYEGDYSGAERQLLKSLADLEKAYGAAHLILTQTLTNLAKLYSLRGDSASAESAYRRALEITERNLGPWHPKVAEVLDKQARSYASQGNSAKALELIARSSEIDQRAMSAILAGGSEEDKRLHIARLAQKADFAISLVAQTGGKDSKAINLALQMILHLKGLDIDVIGGSEQTLRQHLSPQDRILLDQINSYRADLSALLLKGPNKTDTAQYRASVANLEKEIVRLESAVRSRPTALGVLAQPVTLEMVQQAIPKDAVLIELYAYEPFDVAKRGSERQPKRYAAFVLKGGQSPVWVEIGAAAEIDKVAESLGQALRNAKEKRADSSDSATRQLAHRAYEMLLRPLNSFIGDSTTLLIAPDGPLNMLPFAVLLDETDQFLIERYAISYLTSGRDLVRLQYSYPSAESPVIVANPDFKDEDKPKTTSGNAPQQSPDNRRSKDFNIKAQRLSPVEEQKIAGFLPKARIFTESNATESAVKSLQGPSILHIATLAFYLPDQAIPSKSSAEAPLETVPQVLSENPLLRSGLLLAGANRLKNGNEDGVLTALEASGLDLWGTRLVVLSACETGGSSLYGEGIYSLRRALVVSGAETQLLSLWRSDEQATNRLMIDYYKGVTAGQGRSEALRNAQLKMLKDEKYSHPYYWATYTVSGLWTGLEDKNPKRVAATRQDARVNQ